MDRKKVTVFITLVFALVLLTGQAQAATGTIGWAKSLPSGTVLSKPIIGVVSTATFICGFGYVSYIQDQNRASGIMVDSTGVAGQIVQVTGTVSLTSSGEHYIANSILTPTGTGQVVAPLGITAMTAGSFTGLDNTGLMVQVTGTVTSLGYSPADFAYYAYIDDGSGFLDGTSGTEGANKGIRAKGASSQNFQIGNVVSFTGVIGRDADGSQIFKLINERVNLTELSTPRVYAIGGNGMIYLNCNGDPCAQAYRIYRSETRTGTYTLIGQSTGTDYSYLDKPLPNGATRWYKATSISGNLEGPASVPVSATTNESAPTVSILTQSLDPDGILDITYDCAPGVNGTAIPMVLFDIDGESLWDDSPAELNGSWCYDTTELANGVHTIGVKVISSNATSGERYLGYDIRSFTIDNEISNFVVSEIADAITPFEATLKTECNWTISVRQGMSVLGTQSGVGREIKWLWDTATASAGSAEVEVLYSPVTGSQQNSTASIPRSKISTFWVGGRLLAVPGYYQWAAWYPNDQNISGYSAWKEADLYFRSNFNFPVNGYSRKLNEPSDLDIDGEVLGDLEQEYNPYKISHLIWSGHGHATSDSYVSNPNLLQVSPMMAHFVGEGDWWHGLSPFRNYYDTGAKWDIKALGPRLGNFALWKKAGKGRGRAEIVQMERRFKFAAFFSCSSARGIMPLALGIPRKVIPGSGCAYIGFRNLSWADISGVFASKFFAALKEGKTVGEAINKGKEGWDWLSNNPDYREKILCDPRVLGDPNLKIGKYAL